MPRPARASSTTGPSNGRGNGHAKSMRRWAKRRSWRCARPLPADAPSATTHGSSAWAVVSESNQRCDPGDVQEKGRVLRERVSERATKMAIPFSRSAERRRCVGIISVKCPCGRTLKADAKYAGRKGKCPSCGAYLRIPGEVPCGPATPIPLPEAVHESPSCVLRGRRYRVMMFGASPVMPKICVVTGETATMESSIPRFLWGGLAGSPALFVWQFHRQLISLPFSAKGLAAYKEKRPFFSLVLAGGLLVARYIPLFPADIIWLFLCCSCLCWLPLIDKMCGRRNLCIAHSKSHIITPEQEFDVGVTSREFTNEFLRLNPSAFEAKRGYAYRLGFCQDCNARLPINKKRCYHFLHCILTLLTGGLWGIVWLKVAFSGPWCCTRCSSRRVLKA